MPVGHLIRREANARRCALLVLLALLLVAGCSRGRSGDQVAVDVEQQKELNKLLTEDYSEMYREKYQSQPAPRKAP